MYGHIKDPRWQRQRHPDTTQNMPWQHSALYSEARRYLKNPFTRCGILALLLLMVIYTFSSATDYKKQSYGAISLPVVQGPLISSVLQYNGTVVDTLKVHSKVGKVHAVFGEPNPVYERALKLHQAHSEAMGHPMFVLRERILSGLWSKPAIILAVMLNELAKPEDERLHWLLWIDADIVVMNPSISLDVFIPPKPEFSYVNVLVTNDRHGLNNGCFLIRINPWAVKLLSAVIAFHTFRPEVVLKYSEQSALEEMIEDSYWRKAVVHVPQYWFNAYPTSNKDSTTPLPHEFRPGGLQIHFAGNKDGKRPDRMTAWMSIAEQGIAPYNVPLEQTGLLADVTKFWTHLSEERTKKGIIPVKEG